MAYFARMRRISATFGPVVLITPGLRALVTIVLISFTKAVIFVAGAVFILEAGRLAIPSTRIDTRSGSCPGL